MQRRRRERSISLRLCNGALRNCMWRFRPISPKRFLNLKRDAGAVLAPFLLSARYWTDICGAIGLAGEGAAAYTCVSSKRRDRTMPKITPHEALVYIMITMSAADRQISDRELERIAQVVRQLPVFMGYDVNGLAKTAESCGDILSNDDGLEQLLEIVSGALPKKL